MPKHRLVRLSGFVRRPGRVLVRVMRRVWCRLLLLLRLRLLMLVRPCGWLGGTTSPPLHQHGLGWQAKRQQPNQAQAG